MKLSTGFFFFYSEFYNCFWRCVKICCIPLCDGHWHVTIVTHTNLPRFSENSILFRICKSSKISFRTPFCRNEHYIPFFSADCVGQFEKQACFFSIDFFFALFRPLLPFALTDSMHTKSTITSVAFRRFWDGPLHVITESVEKVYKFRAQTFVSVWLVRLFCDASPPRCIHSRGYSTRGRDQSQVLYRRLS